MTATQAKGVEAAKTVADMVAALDSIVDERASPCKRELSAGNPILQPTDERRRTGSHYTPRSLTEPIVRYALEPAFERIGPDATPEQILDLKVCDPAMGSGAFLVEACRALAAKLVVAWARWPKKKPIVPADEDEELHARRLVAQRCLYGVDKNPLATDLAKLSLWLATLARDHEFTFLDHALKSGDSLVGLTEAQIAAVHWDASKPGLPLFRQLVKQRVAEAMKGRAEIQAASDDTARAIQEARHRALETRLSDIRLMGDAVVASFFSVDKPKQRETKRAEIESWLTGSLEAAWGKLSAMTATLRQTTHPLSPFHWELEFPEVFIRKNGGFDATVGNPPFLGGSRISTNLGDKYLAWLLALHSQTHGNGDLVAHFFRRAFNLLREGGSFGLIATNTIGQGDTRSSGLEPILSDGGSILRVVRSLKWPGEAAVIVAVVHILKGVATGAMIDGRGVSRISAYLVEGDLDRTPSALESNAGQAFEGCKIYGQGFLFDDIDALKGETSTLAEMERLIETNQHNKERIFPYLGGDEISSHPAQAHHRFVIDFFDFPLGRDDQLTSWWKMTEAEKSRSYSIGIVPRDYPAPVAGDWPELLAIVRDRVKPFRDRQKRAALKQRWWQYGEKRPGLRKATEALKQVLVLTRISPHISFCFVPNEYIFQNMTHVFAIDAFCDFAILQSRVHEVWARFFAATLEDRISYSLTDCYRTFPNLRTEDRTPLNGFGSEYHSNRASLMLARNEGMTKIYNRFHDRNEMTQDIQRLRELHVAMDRAVLQAYGWQDLAERASPTFLDEGKEDDHIYQSRLFWPSDFRDEVLARLLALNAERHAAEVRLGIAPGMKTKKGDDGEEFLDFE